MAHFVEMTDQSSLVGKDLVESNQYKGVGIFAKLVMRHKAVKKLVITRTQVIVIT